MSNILSRFPLLSENRWKRNLPSKDTVGTGTGLPTGKQARQDSPLGQPARLAMWQTENKRQAQVHRTKTQTKLSMVSWDQLTKRVGQVTSQRLLNSPFRKTTNPKLTGRESMESIPSWLLSLKPWELETLNNLNHYLTRTGNGSKPGSNRKACPGIGAN